MLRLLSESLQYVSERHNNSLVRTCFVCKGTKFVSSHGKSETERRLPKTSELAFPTAFHMLLACKSNHNGQCSGMVDDTHGWFADSYPCGSSDCRTYRKKESLKQLVLVEIDRNICLNLCFSNSTTFGCVDFSFQNYQANMLESYLIWWIRWDIGNWVSPITEKYIILYSYISLLGANPKCLLRTISEWTSSSCTQNNLAFLRLNWKLSSSIKLFFFLSQI